MDATNLAIIIPAYKKEFLKATLHSLSEQVNPNFTVYVGDDCSPENLMEVVSEFSEKLSIKYVCFSENLGGKDLVAHWSRCLDLIGSEEFFCLFSDDDIMEPWCVDAFYDTLKSDSSYNVFHFDIDIIDGEGKLIHNCPAYPPLLSSYDFFKLLYTSKIDARMPEFIFRTAAFRKKGGFVKFDLAYRSDNATVMLYASDTGICSIPGAKVLWRDSGKNISSKKKETFAMKLRKVMATIDFMNWAGAFFKANNQIFPLSNSLMRKLILTELVSLYPECSFWELTKRLRRLQKIRMNPYYFLYYWVDLFLILYVRN